MGKHKGKITKKVVARVVGVVVLLAVALAAGFLAYAWQSGLKQKSPAVVAQEAQDLAIGGKYAAAQTQIDDALKRSDLSKDDTFNLLFQLGSNQQTKGDNAAALASYKKAADVKQTRGVYNAMGSAAAALGDKTLAIEYYKKAIEHILPPPANPLADDDKLALQQKIIALGGQP